MKNNKQYIPTVTIAICALNESANIGPLMESIKKQNIEGFILEKILLISDGSTDETVKIAKSIGVPKLEVRDYKKRLGKSTRLNEIYGKKGLKSDIVVQPDADVILAHKNVIRDVVKPFSEGKHVGMTGGNPYALPAETFTEKAVNCTLEVYIPFRKSLNGGNNILSATGRLLAVRREVFENIIVPRDTIANDGYVYFCTITQGYQYRFAEKAKVYFRSPQTLKDHINQNTRFKATHTWMKQFFPAELVEHEYAIPAAEIRKKMIAQLLRHPILSLYIYAVNNYCNLRAFILKKKITALWDIVYSTKRLKAAK